MQQTPRSARTNAPASNVNSFPEDSRTAAHVRPAEVVPLPPEARTERGQSVAANLRNCD